MTPHPDDDDGERNRGTFAAYRLRRRSVRFRNGDQGGYRALRPPRRSTV